jgi:hypothetical protein
MVRGVSVGTCFIKSSEVVARLLLATLTGGVWGKGSAVGVTSGKSRSDN